MPFDDAASVLGTAEFFDLCDAQERTLLAFASERRLFARRDVLYKSGDIPDGAHVLVAGNLSALPEGDTGKPQLVTQPGSVIGAMALVVAKPRFVTITAITAAETLFVPRAAFMKLARQSPDLARRAAERIQGDIGAFLAAIEPMRGRIK